MSVGDWAEIRRLHNGEGVPIKEIVRLLGVSRNTVRAALRADRPPEYQRPPKGSLVDVVEPAIRALLVRYPRMPATVLAERIGWQHSASIFRARVALIRPEYLGVDPVDRTEYSPGEIGQCDLWFPATKIPVGDGTSRILPVLVMALGYSRTISAVMIPSRQAGDILAGMWQLIHSWGRCPKMLVWDRESAIGGTGRVSMPAAAFAGTLATKIRLAPVRDPEFKGLVERANGYLETSFLPAREFSSPDDFNAQLSQWLTTVANQRTVQSIHARPIDRFEADYQAMVPLPPVVPPIGLVQRIRLARDYYVRVDTNSYSVHPKAIGKFVDVVGSLTTVRVTCEGAAVAEHHRSWGKQQILTDPVHKDAAHTLRVQYAQAARTKTPVPGAPGTNPVVPQHHRDGHAVALRALPDYDALFGVDFHHEPADTKEGS